MSHTYLNPDQEDGHDTKPPAAPEPQKLAPAAEMPEGWHKGVGLQGEALYCRGGEPWFSLDEIRALLATQGLRVVSEADFWVLERDLLAHKVAMSVWKNRCEQAEADLGRREP